jgi:serine/threonine protein kinase
MLTPNVTTALYRAPEVFLGQKVYSEKVDMWACGLILFELLTLKELLPTTQGELGVINAIFHHFGFPTEETWPGVHKLARYEALATEFKKAQKLPASLKMLVNEARRNIDNAAFDLLYNLLAVNPDKRLTAEQALSHPYLTTTAPLPCELT